MGWEGGAGLVGKGGRLGGGWGEMEGERWSGHGEVKVLVVGLRVGMRWEGSVREG